MRNYFRKFKVPSAYKGLARAGVKYMGLGGLFRQLGKKRRR